MASDFPRTIVGLMFLDMKGYSSLKEPQLLAFAQNVMPEVAKVAELDKHDYVNTWGDAIVLACADVKQLARSAAAIRDFLRAFDWSHHGLSPVEARISLHMGTIYKGADPFSNRGMIVGGAINLTARIEPMVVPGEIWTTKDFITTLGREHEPPFRWRTLGNKKLAKNYGEEELFLLYRSSERDPYDFNSTSVIVVRREGKVLLVRRIDGQSATWQFPAGQVKKDGDPVKAAVKECRQETGVTCGEPTFLGERTHPNTGIFVRYFLADWVAGEASNMDDSENDAVEWVSPKDAIRRFTTDLDPRVRKALEEMG